MDGAQGGGVATHALRMLTARRVLLALVAAISSAGGLLLSGVNPVGAAGVAIGISIVVFGLGVSLWRLTRAIDLLHVHNGRLWESQKSDAARLERLESGACMHQAQVAAPVTLDAIAARIHSFLQDSQNVLRDTLREEFSTVRDQAEYRYELLTDQVT